MRVIFLLFSLWLLALGCGEAALEVGGAQTDREQAERDEKDREADEEKEKDREKEKEKEDLPSIPPSESFDPTEPNIDWEQATETTWNACHPENLRQISVQRDVDAQIALGLPPGFAGNYQDMQRGNTYGLMGLDRTRNVAFVAWRHSGNVDDLAALTRLMEAHVSSLSARELLYAPFTSWDAPSPEANALRVSFHLSGPTSMSPAGRVNSMALALLGAGSGLPEGGDVGSIQHVRAQYVLRNNEAIVVLAVALNINSTHLGEGFFGLADVAGGAALARYFDRPRARCEVSRTERKAVDFLFVVDDSASMGTSQGRLALAGTAMAHALDNSTLDWRAALVTSSYHLSGTTGNRNIIRGFTNDLQKFQSWLRQGSTCQTNNTCSPGTGFTAWTAPAPGCVRVGSGHGFNGGCWIGTSGAASEGMLGAARLGLMNLRESLRKDADIVVVILTDTEDQTRGLYFSGSNTASNRWEPVEHFVDFFQGRVSQAKLTASTTSATIPVQPIRDGLTLPVHAIYCPAGQTCGDSRVPSGAPTRIQRVVEETGGFLSDIRNNNGIAGAMQAIVDDIIGRAGIGTQEPFIGASMRVAIQHTRGECDRADVPRSRVNGFDYDGFAQTVSFFGTCRPPVDRESHIAISYRTWQLIERIPCEEDPNFDETLGACKNLFLCDLPSDTCVCPANPLPICGSGTCEANTICHTDVCLCRRDLQ